MAHLPARIIPGGIHRDARWAVRHVNAFGFENVDRFYAVTPAKLGEVRGWVGHRKDWKWLYTLKGKFDVGVVQPETWEGPSRHEEVKSFRLDAEESCLLEVPPGSYTACRTMVADSILLVFSSGKIETAVDDDFLLPPDHWMILQP
jgi:hypothetical protein